MYRQPNPAFGQCAAWNVSPVRPTPPSTRAMWGAVTLTAFDKGFVRQLGLNVGATTAAPLGWVSVEVDSVTVSGTSNFTTKTFNAGLEGLQLNNYQVPAGTPQPAAR